MKRAIDLLFSLTGFIILFPVLILVAILVAIFHGFPVLFTQNRPGKDEKIFKMYKFRSMTNEKDIEGNLLPNDKRMTAFGKFLRHSSLDEIPSLINIIKGDLSLVGPRPLLVDYLELYNDFQKQRHNVKPGLTGWAQVNGRNAISWEERFKLDVWYVENKSLWLDIKILAKTIVKVVSRDGITHEGDVAMPRFKGSHFSKQTNS